MSSETVAVDLASPDAFVDGAPHEALAVLRRTDPVHWQPMDGEPGFWAVLRHADVAHVARHTEIFSASEGGIVLENMPPELLAMQRNMLLAMDPPAHTKHRAPLSLHFRARVIGAIEDRVRAICRAIMADARDRRDVEFIHEVASPLPTQVIGELFGLRPQDWNHIHELAERNTSAQDPDIADAGGQEAATIEMAMYAIELAANRRQGDHTDDLTTAILEADFGGQPMSDIEFGSFFVQLVTAGNDTTKGMLGSGLLTLLRHPEQLSALRADPTLIPGAVEEIIRYANPLHYFRRTALADTELAGTRIAPWPTDNWSPYPATTRNIFTGAGLRWEEVELCLRSGAHCRLPCDQRGPSTRIPTPSPSMSPSRGRWSTALSTSTADDSRASTPTPQR
jgi:cytochrome P450